MANLINLKDADAAFADFVRLEKEFVSKFVHRRDTWSRSQWDQIANLEQMVATLMEMVASTLNNNRDGRG